MYTIQDLVMIYIHVNNLIKTGGWKAIVECWKLTFIQIIPARPLWRESVELTISEHRGTEAHHITSHHKLTIYTIGS